MDVIVDPFSAPCQLLLATDLSERSDRALERAKQLAHEWDAKLDVVTVAGGPQDPDQILRWIDSEDQDFGYDLIRRQVQKDFPQLGIAVRLHILRGDVPKAIREAAAILRSDLVIVGMGRDEGVWRILLGSTAERLASQMEQPLLAVRNRVYAPYRQILIATNFSPMSLKHIKKVVCLFSDRNFIIYHACESSLPKLTDKPYEVRSRTYDNAAAESRRFLDSCDFTSGVRERVRLVIEEKALGPGLGSYVRDHDIDLVVTKASTARGMIKILLGTTTDQLLHWLPCDTLIFPDWQ